MHSERRMPKATRQKLRLSKKQLLYIALGLVGILLLVQLFFPGDRLLPFTKIDGVKLGFKTKSEATKTLNTAYDKHPIEIFMGSGKKPVTAPTLKLAGIVVDNTSRLKNRQYPWYMRLVPTSIFWAGLREDDPPKPKFGNTFDEYVSKHLMPSCQEKPTNATLKADGDKLVLVSARPGGQCEQAEVTKSIKQVAPTLKKPTEIRVAREELAPEIKDQVAKQKIDELETRLASGVAIAVQGEAVTIPKNDVISWLDFAAEDGGIVVSVNPERANDWIAKNIASKVAVAPGVSYITTVDFTETDRREGANGQALDVPQTIDSIEAVVRGESTQANAALKVIPPTEQYTRTYSASDTGLTAAMTNFAKDHPGTYGVSMVELDGKKRRASYNGDKQFVTASTYKLFVAYSMMKQIDSGKRDWDSNAACFNKMISLSDNPCSESFLNSLGLSTVTNDIQAIGLKNSTFMKSGGPFTTANDLSLELGMIATSQNFSTVNQQRLIAAMKGNVYRNGIPAGVNGTVADKVGFLNGLLHDAAIVYSPAGTYVLAIMTDGSSWGNIAALAKQLDQLHAQ